MPLFQQVLYFLVFFMCLFNSIFITLGGAGVSEQQVTPTTQCRSNADEPNSRPAQQSNPKPVTPTTPTTAGQNWVDRFQVPMNRLSTDLASGLNDGKRLLPSIRKEFVRIVVEEMTKLCRKPYKKHCDAVAKLLVTRYPQSLCDSIDGDVVGTGFDSLSRQLKARVDNINRLSVADRLRDFSPSTSTESSGEENGSPVSKKRKLDYGCLNATPKNMPENETSESLNSKKDALLTMYNSDEPKWNLQTIHKLMGETFFLQRIDINKGSLVSDLVKEWPFLFHFYGMKAHISDLMSVDMEELIVTPKIKRVLAFLMKHDFSKYPRPIKEQVDFVIKDMTKSRQNQDISLPAAVFLLMSYFSEEYEALFLEVDVSISFFLSANNLSLNGAKSYKMIVRSSCLAINDPLITYYI